MSFNRLPVEIIEIISSKFITIADKISARQVNIILWTVIHFMDIKISCMNDKIKTNYHQNVDPIYLINYWEKKKLKLIDLGACINSDCIYYRQWDGERMGMTEFYYPVEIIQSHDHDGDPYGPNYEYPHRERACQESKCTHRYIPYCQKCMVEFVNFGYRDDGLEVPYENINGLNNL